MMDIVGHRIKILRSGNYFYNGAAHFSNNSTSCNKYISIGLGGSPTSLYPRDHQYTLANFPYHAKMNGIATLTTNDLITAQLYYDAGTPSPAITGDTAVTANENYLIITEIPTW
jgi:hypothetical protein